MINCWIDAINNIVYQNNFTYGNVTVNTSPPIFIDKTIATEIFHDDFNSQQLSRVEEVMNNMDAINMNILCPWKCSGSVLQSGRVTLDLMLQYFQKQSLIPIQIKKDSKILHQVGMIPSFQ